MWGKIDISDCTTAVYSAGTSKTYLRRAGDEWLIAVDYSDEGGEEAAVGCRFAEEELTDEKSWKRYVASSEMVLELLPALPDRALVIRPDAPISVLPGKSGTFFVSIPVWLNFCTGSAQKQYSMAEVPSVVLSNTWFGDPAAGELCYSLDAPLLRSHKSLSKQKDRAICTFTVTNDTSERMDFQRICVHVENLSLFSEEDGLWTNELHATFKGVDQISQVSIRPSPPVFLRKPMLTAKPRTPSNKSILRRSFYALRQFTGF